MVDTKDDAQEPITAQVIVRIDCSSIKHFPDVQVMAQGNQNVAILWSNPDGSNHVDIHTP